MQHGELDPTNNEASDEGKIGEVNASQQFAILNHQLAPTK